MKRIQWPWVLVMSLPLWTTLGAWAGSSADLVEAEFGQLERDIPSLYLLNGLCLSPEQSQELATLVQKAGKVHKQEQADLDRTEKRFGATVESYEKKIVSKVAAGRSIGPADGEAAERNDILAGGRREVFATLRECDQKLDALSDRVYALLAGSQRDILQRFTPCFIPPHDFRNPERVGQAAEDLGPVEQVISRLRRTPDDKLKEAQCAAADRLTGYTMEKCHMPYSREAEEGIRWKVDASLKHILPKIRTLSDADFELEKTALARQLVPPPPAAKKDDIQAARWKIKTYLLNTGNLEILQARAHGAPLPTALPVHTAFEPARHRHKPMQTFWTAAALSGLELTPDQADTLLKTVNGVIAEKQKVEELAQKARADAIEPCRRLEQELAAQQPTAPSELEASRAHGAVKTLHQDRLRNVLLKAEEDVDRLLSADQVKYLAEQDRNIRCVEDTADIKRTRGRARRFLARAREMTSIEFSRDGAVLSENYVKTWSKKHDQGDPGVDIAAEVNRLMGILEGARALTETRYAQQKESLAASLCPVRSVPRPPSYGSWYHDGEPVELPTRVSELLFNDTAAGILEKRATAKK